MPKQTVKYELPASFRPLLWSLRWRDIRIDKDKEDIIVNTINEGTLADWHWLIETYGKKTIRRILQRRLATEFHPESLRLASIIFSLSPLHYARRGTRTARQAVIPQTR